MPVSIEYKYNSYKPPPHDSYMTLIQNRIHSTLIKKIENTGYQNEQFVISLTSRDPLYYLAHQPIFLATIYEQVTENIMGSNLRMAGSFDVTLIDKSWGIRHGDRVFDPQKYRYDLNGKVDNDRMSVYLEHFRLFPPQHVIERQIEEEAEKLIDELNDLCHFPVEIRCGWPDVIFEVYFNDSVSIKTMHEIEILFSECATAWNKSKNNKRHDSIIPYVGDVHLQKANQMIDIHVDFGDCNPKKVLIFVIKYISDSTLNVKKVLLT